MNRRTENLLDLGVQQICDALHDLVPFAQFKKRKKHPWRNDTFNTKIITPPWVFPHFLNCGILNCRNGSKSRKASRIKILKA